MTEERDSVVVITGPTASGKSALAVKLALSFGGEIVNADSMQVYRGMDAGTAKPSAEERKAVPHHLLDVVDPDEEFNAALYRSRALAALQEITERGKIGFVVGGTGLYIKTLLGGLLPCPPTDMNLRNRLQEELRRNGSESLHKRLEKIDPESARRIHPHDRVRILRALEIIHLTRNPHSVAVRGHGFGEEAFQPLKICLQMERARLYHRINERCVRMIEEGLIRETERLLQRGFSPELKAMKALGYRHMVGFLQGAWDLHTALRELQKDTRRYAKRQLTWFRADPDMVWFDAEDETGITERIRVFLSEEGETRSPR